VRRLAVKLVGELRRLDRRIAAVSEQLSAAVDASGMTLTATYGISAVAAPKLLAELGPSAGYDRPTRSLRTQGSHRSKYPLERSCVIAGLGSATGN
jgi:hypothetical protein